MTAAPAAYRMFGAHDVPAGGVVAGAVVAGGVAGAVVGGAVAGVVAGVEQPPPYTFSSHSE